MKAPCILMGGKLVDLANLQPDDVDLETVATALWRIRRFNGHTLYTVLEHSLAVAHAARRHALARQPADEYTETVGACAFAYGLLHDAHEAYVGDLTRPVRTALSFSTQFAIAALEDDVSKVVIEKLLPQRAAVRDAFAGALWAKIEDLAWKSVADADEGICQRELLEFFDYKSPKPDPLNGMTAPLRFAWHGKAATDVFANYLRDAIDGYMHAATRLMWRQPQEAPLATSLEVDENDYALCRLELKLLGAQEPCRACGVRAGDHPNYWHAPANAQRREENRHG